MPQQNDTEFIDKELERFSKKLPRFLGTPLQFLLGPTTRWLRISIGILFIIGGFLGAVLPLLGIWMIPIGIMLLAKDVPPLRRPIRRLIEWFKNRRKKR